ncbi:MAG TPA: hypothetical protein VKA68_03785, partial [bacterium]|nr:hypothetical protein [bacterium]
MVGMSVVQAQEEAKLGDGFDGNRSYPAHIIQLYDAQGDVIQPEDQPLLPFSTQQTCQECHDYEEVSKGLHFNYMDPTLPAGRRGEPWVLVDRKTSTQIPLSYRPWEGTHRPKEVDLSPWEFIQIFGRHLPGGGAGAEIDPEDPDQYMRWMISGDLEINCLACHDAEASHDQAEYALQVARQNFRWAATATAGFASVEGSAADVPDNYDIYLGVVPDEPRVNPPQVHYDDHRFNENNEVFFDIERDVPEDRCYFCHSATNLEKTQYERWETDEDVHLTSGMTCVDCHRNALDHKMIRGYEGERQAQNNPYAATLTCEGCHLGQDNSEIPRGGRLGAPEPEHAGIPLVHFDVLTCTACHSGPWPSENTQGVKTARIHALGLHGTNKSPDVLPHVQYPVFVKGENGKIAPHKLFWPAYWGYKNGEEIQPIPPDEVAPIANEVLVGDTVDFVDWPPMQRGHVVQILQTLSNQAAGDEQPIYLGGGKLYQLNDAGELTSKEHSAAEPYSWALAHDVRTAEQSLGVRSCEDCHAVDAPFSFGNVR